MKTLKLITKKEEKAPNPTFSFLLVLLLSIFSKMVQYSLWSLLIGSNKDNHCIVTFFNSFNPLVSTVEA